VTLEQNKATVRKFFSLMNDGRVEEALGLFGTEGSWWFAGDDGPGVTKTLAGIADQWRSVLSGPARGVQFSERALTAEGDWVAIEMVGSGQLATGAQYRNRYCFVLQVQNGSIVGGREYMDTAHATKAFSGAQ
jgi:ketosteroid isomerase-like protein